MNIRKNLAQESNINKTVVNDQNDQPHLLLFVDINGTIIVNDSARNKDSNAAILQLLAENYSAQWDTSKTTEIMTYRKYIEKYLLVDNDSNTKNKKAQPDDYKGFIEFLEKTNHPLHDEIMTTFLQIKNILSAGDVFPSFLKLVNDLEKIKTPFTIILRTFGNDAKNVIKEIERGTSIKFSYAAIFQSGCLLNNDESVLKTPDEILESIKANRHGAWQDDYAYWHSHNETYAYGKPYPINLYSNDMVSIFFDDNAVDKQILSIQPAFDIQADQSSLQQKLIALGRIVPANTLKAILDEDYFKNCVDFALKQHMTSKIIAVPDNYKVSNHSIFQPAANVVNSTIPLQQKASSSFKLNPT